MNDKIKVKNVILRCGGDSLLPLMLVYMMYIMYLGHGYETTTRALSADLLHGTEGFASILYVALAMLGVSVGMQFCQNLLYKHGNIGDLYSSGTIFWMNLTVGLKVLTGVGSIALLMLGLVNERSAQNEKG